MDKKIITWNDITLDQFIKIQDIVKSDMEDLDKTISIISIITGIENVDELPLTEFNKLVPLMSLLKTKIPQIKLKKEYVLNGTKYIVTDKIRNLTTGQYIDYTNICLNKITLDNINVVVSYLLIPEGKKYNKDYDIDKVAEDVKMYMSMPDINAVADFFVNALKKLLKTSVDYSIKQIIQGNEITFKEKVQLTTILKKSLHKSLKQINKTCLE